MRTLCSAALYLGLALGANASPALEALKEGDMRKLTIHAEPQPVSDALVLDPDGNASELSDWAGKITLVNFWATWCAPCRAEMASLDALQTELGGDDFEVVTIATGRNSLTGIETFFDEEGITALPILLDGKSTLARDMSVLGLPITVILDREGHEIARMRGDADWNSPEARALLDAVIAGD